MPEKKYKWRRENYDENTRGLLIVHTGNGKGKTTCALGLMMRAAGQGLRCCMIQFMKSRTDRYGEHLSAEKLGIEVHTMGDGFTWDTKNPEQDRQTARETWNLCVEKLRSGDYDMLVFDELVYVLSYDMLPSRRSAGRNPRRPRTETFTAHRRHRPRRTQRINRSRRPGY